MNFKLIGCILVAFLLTSCLDTGNQAEDMQGRVALDYVNTDYAGFVIEEMKYVSYKMVYQLNQDLGPDASYKVEFENPRKGSSSFIVQEAIQSDVKRISVLSPRLPGITLGQSYTVTLQLYSKDKAVALHQDKVRFDVPDTTLKRLKVELY